jgi:hypothetical protein
VIVPIQLDESATHKSATAGAILLIPFYNVSHRLRIQHGDHLMPMPFSRSLAPIELIFRRLVVMLNHRNEYLILKKRRKSVLEHPCGICITCLEIIPDKLQHVIMYLVAFGILCEVLKVFQSPSVFPLRPVQLGRWGETKTKTPWRLFILEFRCCARLFFPPRLRTATASVILFFLFFLTFGIGIH